MLEKLNAIDWRQYEHAYGEATDIPDLFRTMLDNPDNTDNVTVFFSNIWHQGTVYSTTSITVPFFIEILDKKLSPHHDIILSLLKE